MPLERVKKDELQQDDAKREDGVRRHLGESIDAALREYLNALAGAPCRGLHRMTIEVVEGELLVFALRHCNGNLCEVARMLGISRTTLGKKMRERGLKRDGARGRGGAN